MLRLLIHFSINKANQKKQRKVEKDKKQQSRYHVMPWFSEEFFDVKICTTWNEEQYFDKYTAYSLSTDIEILL